VDSEFAQWQQQYGGKYTSVAELQLRARVFAANRATIATHNARVAAAGQSYFMAINQFSDLTPDEFAARLSVQQMDLPVLDQAMPTDSVSSLPDDDTWDWREHGAVGPVQNQGQCGAAWAMAACGSMEGAHAVKAGTFTALSVQQLVDCSGNDTHGCNGGNPEGAYKFAVDNGVCKSGDYPWLGRESQCKKGCVPAAHFTSYGRVGTTDAALMNAVRQYGPIAAGVDASRFATYASGVFDGSCGKTINHLVVVIGYGTAQGKPYWILKNSWGTSWGERGYIRLARGKDLCGINDYATYIVAA